MSLILPIVLILASSGIAALLAMHGHVVSPVLVFFFGAWMAVTANASSEARPVFSSSIQITKNVTASEAEKETP